ncbi:MAG: ATP-dependent Clp protease adapter ClpS [Chthoniobacterales bacterium]
MPTKTVEKTSTKTRQEHAPVWNVIVHDDPVNLMSYVTLIFRQVFGYSHEKAMVHMLEVHEKGRSILWSGECERAEFYVHQLHASLLLATMEQQPNS